MPPIEMKSCKSSNVKEWGYDPATRTLAVRFGAGSLYHYKNVPSDIVEDLTDCESIGGFIAKNVRGQFEFEKVVEDQPNG